MPGVADVPDGPSRQETGPLQDIERFRAVGVAISHAGKDELLFGVEYRVTHFQLRTCVRQHRVEAPGLRVPQGYGIEHIARPGCRQQLQIGIAVEVVVCQHHLRCRTVNAGRFVGLPGDLLVQAAVAGRDTRLQRMRAFCLLIGLADFRNGDGQHWLILPHASGKLRPCSRKGQQHQQQTQ